MTEKQLRLLMLVASATSCSWVKQALVAVEQEAEQLRRDSEGPFIPTVRQGK